MSEAVHQGPDVSIIGGSIVKNSIESGMNNSGKLKPEFISQRNEFYVDRRGKKVFIGCSDERDQTEESIALFANLTPEDSLRVEDGFLSVFGGVVGLSKNIIVTAIVQHGPDIVAALGGIEGVFNELVKRAHADDNSEAAIPTLHSDAGKEDDPQNFCDHGNGAVGCAYCGGVGATSALLVDSSNSLVRDTARSDMVRVFGDDRYADPLLGAHQIVLDQATGAAGAAFSVGRAQYIESRLPIMILADKPHMAVDDTGFIVSFVLGQVRNSKKADAQGQDFYSLEAVEVTKLAQRLFPELKLDGEIMLRALVLDSTPVRAVLASHDKDNRYAGQLDPRNLAMGTRGDVAVAIAAVK